MTELKVMTFNIRTSLADDGPDNWVHRRQFVIETIRSHDPDLLGVQEPTERQWEYLTRELDDQWEGVAHSRRDTVGKEPHLQGLFFKRSRIRKLADACFWLSDTPDVPGSTSFPQDWGARTAVWMRAEDLVSRRQLLFAVTHLDTHPESWLPGAKVLDAELKRHAGELPVITVGDFNCAAGSAPWKYLTGPGGFQDAWTSAGHADEGVTTFNAFKPVSRLPLEATDQLKKMLQEIADSVPAFKHYPQHVIEHRNYRIDWILFRGSMHVAEAAIDTRTFNGRTASDHYPVIAVLEWD